MTEETPQERLATAAEKVSSALAEMVHAWVDAECAGGWPHPTDVQGYPFGASLDEQADAFAAYVERLKRWAWLCSAVVTIASDERGCYVEWTLDDNGAEIAARWYGPRSDCEARARLKPPVASSWRLVRAGAR